MFSPNHLYSPKQPQQVSPQYPSEVARRDRPELYRKVEMFQRRNNEDQPATTTNQEDWTPYDDEMLQQQAHDNKIEWKLI